MFKLFSALNVKIISQNFLSLTSCILVTMLSDINIMNSWYHLLVNFILFPLATAEMAEQHPNKVVGVVSQRKLLKNTGQLHFTPGICGSHDLV